MASRGGRRRTSSTSRVAAPDADAKLKATRKKVRTGDSIMCAHCGTSFSLPDWEATVVMFKTHECPNRDGWSDHIKKLAS